jgi:predicted aminopeptidase
MMNASRPVNDLCSMIRHAGAVEGAAGIEPAHPQLCHRHLKLPDNPSYCRYAWTCSAKPCLNVVAASSCSDAEHLVFRSRLCACGYLRPTPRKKPPNCARKKPAYGVPAYSTLGWLNWQVATHCSIRSSTHPDGELARPRVS